MIQVSVVGAKGRMGSHVVDAVNGAEDMQLALALDAGDDLTRIEPANTDVVVEFTVPSVSLGNVLALIAQGVDIVVGTTGWTDEKLAQVRKAIADGPRPDTLMKWSITSPFDFWKTRLPLSSLLNSAAG